MPAIIGKLKEKLPYLQDCASIPNKTLDVEIAEFSHYLSYMHDFKRQFMEVLRNLFQLQKSENFQFFSFAVYLLPQYEQQCVEEYQVGSIEEKKRYFGENEKLNEGMKHIRQSSSLKSVIMKV